MVLLEEEEDKAQVKQLSQLSFPRFTLVGLVSQDSLVVNHMKVSE
jgi:hypothetical protein